MTPDDGGNAVDFLPTLATGYAVVIVLLSTALAFIVLLGT